jgi:cytochrome c556
VTYALQFFLLPVWNKSKLCDERRAKHARSKQEKSMLRTVLVGVTIALGVSALSAQDFIGQRRDLMKQSGAQARIGTQMVRGEAPYDQAKAQAIFQTYIDKAAKLPQLFPDNSKTGGETTASPAIWEKPAEWKAAIAKFEAESKAALTATKDLESFKTQFSMVGRNCGACHETFRVKKS